MAKRFSPRTISTLFLQEAKELCQRLQSSLNADFQFLEALPALNSMYEEYLGVVVTDCDQVATDFSFGLPTDPLLIALFSAIKSLQLILETFIKGIDYLEFFIDFTSIMGFGDSSILYSLKISYPLLLREGSTA